MKSARWRNVYNPSVTSAQRSTVLPFRNSITPGSIVAGRSCGSTAVATIMSQRSLKATDSAVLPGGLRAGERVGAAATLHPGNRDRPAGAEAAKPRRRQDRSRSCDRAPRRLRRRSCNCRSRSWRGDRGSPRCRSRPALHRNALPLPHCPWGTATAPRSRPDGAAGRGAVAPPSLPGQQCERADEPAQAEGGATADDGASSSSRHR